MKMEDLYNVIVVSVSFYQKNIYSYVTAFLSVMVIVIFCMKTFKKLIYLNSGDESNIGEKMKNNIPFILRPSI